MSLKFAQLPEEIQKRFSLKKIMTGFGHDKMGAHADIIFDGRQVGFYDDDGWGGESEIKIEDPAAHGKILALLASTNFNQVMFDGGWQFMEEPDKITFHMQIEEIVNALINKNAEDKDKKRREKEYLKGVIVADKEDSPKYSVLSWRGYKTLDDLLKHPNGRGILQKTVMEQEIQKKVILNKEQLRERGIQVR